jgi:hypothetical protein
MNKSLRTMLLSGSLALAVAITAITTDKTYSAIITQYLKDRPDLVGYVPPENEKKLLTDAIHDLKTKDGTGLLVGASWCYPCKMLEKELSQQGIERKIEYHLQFDEPSQRAYARTRFGVRGILLPEYIPRLIQNENGKLRQYFGYDVNTKTMMDENGNKKRIDEIIR